MVQNRAVLRRVGLVLAVILGLLATPGASAVAAPTADASVGAPSVESPDSGPVDSTTTSTSPTSSTTTTTSTTSTTVAPLDQPSPGTATDAAVTPELDAKVAGGEAKVIAVTTAPGDEVVDEVLAELPDGSARDVKVGPAPQVAMTVDAEGLEALRSAPGVEQVVEDKVNLVAAEPWVDAVGLPPVLTAGWDGTGRTIAVLDTGVQADHPYLGGRVVQEACFSTNAPSGGVSSLCPGGQTQVVGAGAATPCSSGLPGCQHGTHVAGIAAGGPVSSYTGVARTASIIAVKVFSRSDSDGLCGSVGAPCLVAYDSDISAALAWLDQAKVADEPFAETLDVVNLSLGGGLYAGTCDTENAIKPPVDSLGGHGVAVVAASGNNGVVGKMASPACISSVVSVGATTGAGVLGGYSNLSSQTDLLAPGSSITSSTPGSSYGQLTGTSMATPIVAAAFADLREEDPNLSAGQILARLQATGTSISTSAGSFREVQLDSALLGVPGQVTSLAARPVSSMVTISWPGTTPTGDASITGYTVTATPGGGSCTTSGAGRECTVGGLTNGTRYTFDVRATNSVGTGSPGSVSSTPVGLPAGSPLGSVDVVSTGVGSVRVAGWALDPETRNPIQVHAYVDGTGYVLDAGKSRPDVDAAFGYGAAHGFDASLPAGGGTHTVCLYAINVGVGSNVQLGCRSVTVPAGSPFGSLDVVSAGVGSVSLAGWAIDPDTTGSIQVHVYVDGTGYPLNAAGSRPDVGAAFQGYGASHGFSATLPAPGGPHTVCAYAINVGAGSNTSLGCRSVTVPSGSPFGSLDVATRNPDGTLTVSGWAIDPDTTAPIQVHVYFIAPTMPLTGIPLIASQARGDVGAVFPAYGSAHAFSATFAMPRDVILCAYAINVGVGENTGLRCASVP